MLLPRQKPICGFIDMVRFHTLLRRRKDLFMLYKDLKSTGENLYHSHPLCRVRYVKRLEKENDKCGTGSRMPE